MGNLSGDREAGSEVSWGGERLKAGISGFVTEGVRLKAVNDSVRLLWERQFT